MTVTSLKIRALPAKLGSRNTISDKFTVVRGSLVVKGLQCNNWIYWVECAYTAKSGSEIHSFRCEFYDKQTKRPNIYINSTTMDFKSHPSVMESLPLARSYRYGQDSTSSTVLV